MLVKFSKRLLLFFGYSRNLKFRFPSAHFHLTLSSWIPNCQNVVFHTMMEIIPQLENPYMELLIPKLSSGMVAPPWGIWSHPGKAEAEQSVQWTPGEFYFCIQDREDTSFHPPWAVDQDFMGGRATCSKRAFIWDRFAHYRVPMKSLFPDP